VATTDDQLRTTLAAVAPGTALRDGLERILRGNTGALIVLGHDKVVDQLATGGFTLDVEFSAQRLRELSKMDGAVVVTADLARITRASVQLVPDPNIPTDETGTRHRTAERVAKQTGFPVVSVSASMRIIALYIGGTRYVLDDSAAILSRANQALATSSATSCASTRSRAPCRRSRSRTSSPSATPWRSASAWRWCGGSPPRSRATSSSSAPTAACSACSSRS
jgi:DNA integrity scanning protein DisA with diadenylate cyclase activity